MHKSILSIFVFCLFSQIYSLKVFRSLTAIFKFGENTHTCNKCYQFIFWIFKKNVHLTVQLMHWIYLCQKQTSSYRFELLLPICSHHWCLFQWLYPNVFHLWFFLFDFSMRMENISVFTKQKGTSNTLLNLKSLMELCLCLKSMIIFLLLSLKT